MKGWTYTVVIMVQSRQKKFFFYKKEVKVGAKRCMRVLATFCTLSEQLYSLRVLVLLKRCGFLFADGFVRSRDQWQEAIRTIC